MLSIPVFTILISILANCVFCKTKFLRPPEWNPDVDGKDGLEKNKRYKVGDKIQLLWETDLEDLELYVVQKLPRSVVPRLLDPSLTEWTAQWDIAGSTTNNEDSVYSFTLINSDHVFATQRFNVTPQNRVTTTITTIKSMSSQQEQTSTTHPISTSTTTDQRSNEEEISDAGPDYDSGMSRGEVAGAAVGGTIGGLLLLGAVGWLVWRRLAKIKKDTDVSVVTQSQQQQFHSSELKAELPGDPAVEAYQSGYARSPPGLHEAP